MSTVSTFEKRKKVHKSRKGSLWKGPTEDGVTQSMIKTFLICRERFRIKVVEGLEPAPKFRHQLEYGQFWHTCEEAMAQGEDWEEPLKQKAKELAAKYRNQQEQVLHWYNVCRVQFPEYVKYWKTHKDVKQRVPILQEEVFRVPYRLPSGSVVILRGRWDSVDLIGPKTRAKLYLQENKTKGQVIEEQLKQQLQFDLQTMMYLIALRENLRQNPEDWAHEIGHLTHKWSIGGVRYNVVRRPLSGGKGSIKQHKPSKKKPQGESKEAFYERLRRDHIAKEPEHFFMRWKAEITKEDIDTFEERFFIPILEQLCQWWNWISQTSARKESVWGNAIHWQHPYGVYNVLTEGGKTDLDEYIMTGSKVGLQRVDRLFTELE